MSKELDSDYEEQLSPSICPRCQCCSQDWEDCYNCEDGFSDHDCGDDTCCCLDPYDNVRCDICDGRGGWQACIGDCDSEGKHGQRE